MTPTRLAHEIKKEMEELRDRAMDPGFSDFISYREAVARYNALKLMREKLGEPEDD